MALDADLLIDRRRLKRRLALWRGAAVLLLVLGAALLGRGSADGFAGLAGSGHVARLAVSGVITEDRKLLQALERARQDAAVRAVLVSIDSPGGSVGGGEALHAALLRMAGDKPVVAVLRGTAASAGYMAALPASRIFARESTVTGSIGVLLQTPDASELLSRLGIRMETIVSGPLKDQPNPFHPLSPEGRAALERVVRDLYDQFVGMVVRGRGMEEARVRELADGRVFTGRQALAAGLIDAIGGEPEARAWLAAERGVAERLPVRDIEVRSRAERLLEAAWRGFTRILISEGLGVDGFRALWQPLR
ncbi:MAG: signal peptide peptidase SppA [Acetobacteraceae bacterium]|nr:signal peptide peptidase SppA [Acetobacteraceae bacterium]